MGLTHSSELRSERSRRSEAEFIQNAKHMELQRILEDERITHREAMLQLKEESEQAIRSLQVRPTLLT
jgi:hypothetical protein